MRSYVLAVALVIGCGGNMPSLTPSSPNANKLTVAGETFSLTRSTGPLVDITFTNSNDNHTKISVTRVDGSGSAIDRARMAPHTTDVVSGVVMPSGSIWKFHVWIWKSGIDFAACLAFWDVSCYKGEDMAEVKIN